jgi:cytochrome c peroxidase
MTLIHPPPWSALVRQRLAAVLASALLAACGGGDGGSGGGSAATMPTVGPLAALGERIFNDRNLSGSGRMSCASCHDPLFHHGPPNAQAVQVGGQFETEFGLRAAPSIRYLERLPAFTAGPWRGGLDADGRVDTLAAQAHEPLFDPREMDNGSAAALARRLRGAAYASQLAAQLGEGADDAVWVDLAQRALQALQREDPRLHPYDSKFDQVRSGREQFSAAELRGRQAYRDPARGNCAACHPDTDTQGRPPLFTDFGYAALGVPRNSAIPANADAAFFDLGLCGPLRRDLAADPAACGLFRTPGLRNVGVKQRYFHNGAVDSLARTIDFHHSRDTDPARWYPVVDGIVVRYDDLPARYHANVTRAAPMGGRPAGSAPAMTAQDLADIACFLHTLTDGHVAGAPPAAGCRD